MQNMMNNNKQSAAQPQMQNMNMVDMPWFTPASEMVGAYGYGGPWNAEVAWDMEGLALPISADRYQQPLNEVVTKKVEATMDVADNVLLDTPYGPQEVEMFNIPPRTEPVPIFQGPQYFDPWNIEDFLPAYPEFDFDSADHHKHVKAQDHIDSAKVAVHDNKEKHVKAKIVKKFEKVPFHSEDMQSERIKQAISKKFVLVKKNEHKVQDVKNVKEIAQVAHKAAKNIEAAAPKPVNHVKHLAHEEKIKKIEKVENIKKKINNKLNVVVKEKGHAHVEDTLHKQKELNKKLIHKLKEQKSALEKKTQVAKKLAAKAKKAATQAKQAKGQNKVILHKAAKKVHEKAKEAAKQVHHQAIQHAKEYEKHVDKKITKAKDHVKKNDLKHVTHNDFK